MTRNRKFIVAGLALAGIGVAAAGAFAERGGPWEHHGRRGHGGEGMAFGPMGGFCRGDGAEMADHFLVHIDHKVKPTDAQKTAFEPCLQYLGVGHQRTAHIKFTAQITFRTSSL